MNSVDDAVSAPQKETDFRGLVYRLNSSRIKERIAKILYDISGKIDARYNRRMRHIEEKSPLVYSVLTCFIPVAEKNEYKQV
jgi:hypothetical protein